MKIFFFVKLKNVFTENLFIFEIVNSLFKTMNLSSKDIDLLILTIELIENLTKLKNNKKTNCFKK